MILCSISAEAIQGTRAYGHRCHNISPYLISPTWSMISKTYSYIPVVDLHNRTPTNGNTIRMTIVTTKMTNLSSQADRILHCNRLVSFSAFAPEDL